MKIAIISDIHDNLPNLKKCLTWCGENKIEKIICCGDIANAETLQILSSEFSDEIFLIRGNAEIYDEDTLVAYKNINYGGRFAIFQIDGKNVGVCHEPLFIKEFQNNNYGIIFYGHTHKPWIENKNAVQIVNPGTLGGVFTPATFAVWNTDKPEPELKLLAHL